MASSVALALCYSGCGTAWAACYSAAGLVAGTIVASPAAPTAALACNAAESVCMAGCYATLQGTAAAEGAAAPPTVLFNIVGGALVTAGFGLAGYFCRSR